MPDKERIAGRAPQRVVLAAHVFADGAYQACRRYLARRGMPVLVCVTHPLFPGKGGSSAWECLEQGDETARGGTRLTLPGPLRYLWHTLLTVFWVLRQGRRFDLYVGFNNLNAMAGLVLRRLGVVRRCVYHVTDFVPRRFESGLMNRIYHAIESHCARHCDETWNLSLRMVDARLRFKGLKEEDCGPQRETPMGVWLDEQPHVPWEQVDRTQLVFMGHLLEKQGLQHVIRALPAIAEAVPEVSLLVIGKGEYRPRLEEMAQELGVAQRIRFQGFVESHEELERMVAGSALAVALYERGDLERNWTYYTDAGKIKVYLGAGVPVLTTDVPTNARAIEAARCALVIRPEPEDIARAVTGLLADEQRLRSYRENARRYIKDFDWPNIFGPLFG